MKNYLSFKLCLSTLCALALIINVSCEEEDNAEAFEPYRLVIGGETEVAPGDTATYSTSLYENETYTWSVPAGAEIVSGAGTFKIDVYFTADGSGDITVAAGSRDITGTLPVEVVSTAPVASVELESDTILTSGATGNVLITFDKDIDTAPEVTLISSDSTSTGEAITAVEEVDERTFRVTYTAGTGNGVDQISVDNAVSSDFFGAVEMDTVVTFDIYQVDNTPATGELVASRTPVNSTTTTTLSAIFSEPLRTEDSVTVSITQTDALGMTITYVDSATMSTEDGQTWTYDFQPSGDANGLVEVSVGNFPTDVAGNPTPMDAIEQPIIIQIQNE